VGTAEYVTYTLEDSAVFWLAVFKVSSQGIRKNRIECEQGPSSFCQLQAEEGVLKVQTYESNSAECMGWGRQDEKSLLPQEVSGSEGLVHVLHVSSCI
jgi:hypothetical protein